ncbi:hypothetical protein E4T56_gene14407, partial [Termitomyces sp. T112]
MAGASAATKSATRRPHRAIAAPDPKPGPSGRHCIAWPAIDLESCRFLIGPERSARQHPGLAVDLVLVEPDARQVFLHRLHRRRAQLRRSRPRRRKGLRTGHAIGKMTNEQHVEIGEIILLDDEVVLRRQ